MSKQADPATVDGSLRLGGGVHEEERARIVKHWGRLDQRLRSFRSDEVDMEISVKDRDTPSQHTTLETWIARRPRLVATSTKTDFGSALTEVRDDMIRQLTDAKNRTEPRNNRHRRRR
ncbi:MAG: HPF/RaiA family ribosome-associated protein [Acidimicrobiia bacterium]